MPPAPLSTPQSILSAVKQDPKLAYNPDLIKTYQKGGGTLSNNAIPVAPSIGVDKPPPFLGIVSKTYIPNKGSSPVVTPTDKGTTTVTAGGTTTTVPTPPSPFVSSNQATQMQGSTQAMTAGAAAVSGTQPATGNLTPFYNQNGAIIGYNDSNGNQAKIGTVATKTGIQLLYNQENGQYYDPATGNQVKYDPESGQTTNMDNSAFTPGSVVNTGNPDDVNAQVTAYQTAQETSIQNQTDTATTQANEEYTNAVTQENNNYNIAKQNLQKQVNDALAAETASLYAGDPNLTPSSPEIASMREKIQADFQPSFDQLDAQHQNNLTTLQTSKDSNLSNIAISAETARSNLASNVQSMRLDWTKFSQTTKQQAYSDFMNSFKTLGSIDTSTPEGSSAMLGVIQKGVEGGLTFDEAQSMVKIGTLQANKQGMTDFTNEVAKHLMPDGMTIDTAKQDPYWGGVLQEGAKIYGSEQAAWSAMTSAVAPMKSQLDIQAKQASIQNAATRVSIALGNLQLRQDTYVQKQAANITKTLTAKNTPLGNLTAALSFKAIADSALNTIQYAVEHPNDKQAQADARTASSKLLSTDARVFTGGVARLGLVDLETSSQSLGEQIQAFGNYVLGKGPAKISQSYATGLRNAMDTYVNSLVSDPATQAQFNDLKNQRDTLLTQNPNLSADIVGNSSLIDALAPVFEGTTSGGGTGGGTTITKGTTATLNGKTYSYNGTGDTTDLKNWTQQ